MLSSPCQQAIENVKGPLIFGLSNGSWLLQKIWEQKLSPDKEITKLKYDSVVPLMRKLLFCHMQFDWKGLPLAIFGNPLFPVEAYE